MASIKKHLYLSENTIKYIDQVKDKNSLSTRGKALDKIVEEHKAQQKERIQLLSESIAESVTEKIKKDIVRIRLGTNNADRNSQVIVQILNHLMLANARKSPEDFRALVSTDKMKSNIILGAQDYVKKKIEKFRQKNLEKENNQ